MARQVTTRGSSTLSTNNAQGKFRSRKPHYAEIHSDPLPLTIYPSPTLILHNPLSLLHVIWRSISLWFYNSSSHPPQLCKARVSVETQAIHVTDPESVRLLWTHGFFGKGSLSRSEPSWLERERARQGLSAARTSEQVTQKRRAERKEFKKQRAKKERQAIEQLLTTEDNIVSPENTSSITRDAGHSRQALLSSDPNAEHTNNMTSSVQQVDSGPAGDTCTLEVGHEFVPSNGAPGELARPGPRHNEKESSETSGQSLPNIPKINRSNSTVTAANVPAPIVDQEHLQLTPEEAFFLAYGLGVLEIWEDGANEPLSARSLFRLFRQWSYFPPQPSTSLQPDDPFLVSYVAYHHFRSLGWVVRPGVKFGVDYLLYNRGPVFAHAEFAAVIVPSFSHPYFSSISPEAEGYKKKERKPWQWLHCINRVQSQVRKNLLLVFVEVPPPEEGQIKGCEGIGSLLKEFRIREVIVKRWTPNRTRD